MRRLKCEEELAKIVQKVGREYGFELNTEQTPFLVTAIAGWIDKRFGLEEDPVFRRIKARIQAKNK